MTTKAYRVKVINTVTSASEYNIFIQANSLEEALKTVKEYDDKTLKALSFSRPSETKLSDATEIESIVSQPYTKIEKGATVFGFWFMDNYYPAADTGSSKLFYNKDVMDSFIGEKGTVVRVNKNTVDVTFRHDDYGACDVFTYPKGLALFYHNPELCD
jgi:hypothetical protein